MNLRRRNILAIILVLPLLSGAHGLLEAASVRLETSETPLAAWSTDGLPETPMISPNGERVAYVARRGPKFVVVLDGKPGMEWDGIGQDALLFSRDSQHLFYAGQRGSKWMAVADEVAGKEFDGLVATSFRISPDGKRVAYLAKSKDKTVCVADGIESKKYDFIGFGIDLHFSDDWRRLSYIAQRRNKWVAVIDGKESEEYDAIGSSGVAFSPDSRHLAYEASLAVRWVVVVDGVQTANQFDGLFRSADLVFDTPTSLHTVAGRRHEFWRVNIKIIEP